MRIVVTPVTVSPFATAQLIGAAPRYFGSSEAWTLTQPYLGQVKDRFRNDLAITNNDNCFGNDRLDALE